MIELYVYSPCISMQIKPNKSPLRNRLKARVLWEIGHFLPQADHVLVDLLICGGQGGSAGGAPHL